MQNELRASAGTITERSQNTRYTAIFDPNINSEVSTHRGCAAGQLSVRIGLIILTFGAILANLWYAALDFFCKIVRKAIFWFSQVSSCFGRASPRKANQPLGRAARAAPNVGTIHVSTGRNIRSTTEELRM